MSGSGTVKFFNIPKGFGFIIQDNGGQDLFVHATDVQGDGLNEGDKVRFEIETREDGKSRAVGVTGGTRPLENFNRGGYNEGGWGGNRGGNRGANRGYNEGGYGNSYRNNNNNSYGRNNNNSYGRNNNYGHQGNDGQN